MKINSKSNLYLLLLATSLLLNSCKLYYPGRMFQQKEYQYFEFAKKKINEYTIEPGDKLSLQVYSRDGFKLIDVFGGDLSSNNSSAGVTSSNGGVNNVNYIVDKDGYVKLPILGDFYVKGYSHRELENILAQKYSNLYVDPYVIVKVENRRVFVFKGDVGAVVELNETPTNIIEILAKSGGVSNSLKIYKIKLIRGDLSNPTIQLIDLSTIEGLQKADLTLLPNDIIYIEERRRITREIFREITPIFSSIGLLGTTIALIRSFGK